MGKESGVSGTEVRFHSWNVYKVVEETSVSRTMRYYCFFSPLDLNKGSFVVAYRFGFKTSGSRLSSKSAFMRYWDSTLLVLGTAPPVTSCYGQARPGLFHSSCAL